MSATRAGLHNLHYPHGIVSHSSSPILTLRVPVSAPPLTYLLEMRYHSPAQLDAKLSTAYPQGGTHPSSELSTTYPTYPLLGRDQQPNKDARSSASRASRIPEHPPSSKVSSPFPGRFSRALRLPNLGAAAEPLPKSILSPSDRSLEQPSARCMPQPSRILRRTVIQAGFPKGEINATKTPRPNTLPRPRSSILRHPGAPPIPLERNSTVSRFGPGVLKVW